MPTEYTADLLKDGKQITFQEFALRCARAIIGPSDGPSDAPIPDVFTIGGHRLVMIRSFKKHLAEVEKWSNARAEKEAKQAFNDRVRSSREYGQENNKIELAHINMLKQVLRWIPPTKGHQELQNFMAKQLAESHLQIILKAPTIPKRLSGKQYRAGLIKSIPKEIARLTKEYDAEVRSAGEKNDWARALRHSLNIRCDIFDDVACISSNKD